MDLLFLVESILSYRCPRDIFLLAVRMLVPSSFDSVVAHLSGSSRCSCRSCDGGVISRIQGSERIRTEYHWQTISYVCLGSPLFSFFN
jgi:hypothetical protein